MIRHTAAILILCAGATLAADLRLGIIGTDTSHVIEFTKLLNDATSPQHIPGARVTAAYKGGSTAMSESYTRVDRFANELRTRWQVQFVPDIGSLCGSVDGILLESVDGQQHLAQVRDAVKCGKPIWIDKPLASTLADAREIARITRDAGVPWFSASSLRFSEIASSVKSGDNTGAVAWGPGSLGKGGLDLAWYAIHTVELLYAILGPGCQEVTRVHTDASDVIIGRWSGGRIGEVRAMRPGDNYGALAFRPKTVAASPPNAEDSYRPLVVQIVRFFQTGRPPVANEETLETMEFMDAAQRSMINNGAPAKLGRSE